LIACVQGGGDVFSYDDFWLLEAGFYEGDAMKERRENNSFFIPRVL